MSEPEDDFLFPPGMPEEIQEMIKNSIHRDRMQTIVQQHQVSHFIESLDEEQLLAFRMIIGSITTRKNSHQTGYYSGLITQILVHSFGYCMGCGSKHESDLQKLLEGENEKDADNPFKSFADQFPESKEIKEPVKGTQADEENLDEEERYYPGGYQENLKTYRVRQLTAGITTVECLKCGMRYPSLKDRMIKSPDDCAGCYHKDAHG